MSYASTSDLTNMGLPAQALGKLTPTQVQAALDTTAAEIDSYLRGRYDVPLASPPAEIVQANAILAAAELLTIRGWNPENPGDAALMDRAAQKRGWLRDVQRGAAHPNIPEPTTGALVGRPTLLSSSTVAVGSSSTAVNRGW